MQTSDEHINKHAEHDERGSVTPRDSESLEKCASKESEVFFLIFFLCFRLFFSPWSCSRCLTAFCSFHSDRVDRTDPREENSAGAGVRTLLLSSSSLCFLLCGRHSNRRQARQRWHCGLPPPLPFIAGAVSQRFNRWRMFYLYLMLNGFRGF